ncbi:hypothetical protein AciX9_4599 (plasmid) [Granulicella tundricola MP5ACTX9]|uniref:Uncharacterized protein n=1 Tax=Granulicella tundricola (strain ATCC BAA-1859 / DSM 23138 / MP5ACTX9) TaxID=1198114 RepID=E8X7U5_GRATM|nr:hypothetical protein AciX9_4599 [Granulicella tundricola MP5ACTX9]
MREAVGHLKEEARFQTWTVFALILALGFALGAFGTYFFFTRQVSALNSRFDHFEQLLAAPHLLQRTPTSQRRRPGRSMGSTKGRLRGIMSNWRVMCFSIPFHARRIT